MFPFPSKKKPAVQYTVDQLIEKWEADQGKAILRHQYRQAMVNAQITQQATTQMTPYTQSIAWADQVDVNALVRERDELKEENSSLRRMIEARAVVVEE